MESASKNAAGPSEKPRRHRSRNTAERFVRYSRKVLAAVRDDVEKGKEVDPRVIEILEKAIDKHAPDATEEPPDLSVRINRLKGFGSGRRR